MPADQVAPATPAPVAEPSGTAQGAGVVAWARHGSRYVWRPRPWLTVTVQETGPGLVGRPPRWFWDATPAGVVAASYSDYATPEAAQASAESAVRDEFAQLRALAARAREGERLEARVRVAEDRERQNAEVAARWQRAAGEAEREAADLRARLLEREEREAACCPEDVGFPEYIAALRARCERLEGAVAAANRLLGASEVGEPVPDDEWARVRSVLYDALHHPAQARAAESAGEA